MSMDRDIRMLSNRGRGFDQAGLCKRAGMMPCRIYGDKATKSMGLLRGEGTYSHTLE